MSILLPYICCGFTVVVGLFSSLAALGVRDIVRGIATRSRYIVARGLGLLVVAVVVVALGYGVWMWWLGPP
jgi:hypothetical protein